MDRAKAQRNLARLEQQFAPTLMSPLASLLEHSPDPDGALNLLERYAESAPTDVLANIARHPTALTYLVAIFGYSAYLAESLLAEPGLAVQFARDRNFTKLTSREDLLQDFARFATTHPDHWLSAQLARFKRRNYLRIVLKDVLGLSTLGETTFELSTLADVILSNALSFCNLELEKRYGHPQFRDAQGRIVRSGFGIISLGKLGGNELNYSSDIDLLFLYGRDGETSGGNEKDSVVSNKEFFVRLAHAVTRTITQATHHGEVFRVDLRLRPEGEQGDLAISVKSAGEYYERRARDWELQMLIKARHSAGDPYLTREFLRRVEPFIYASPGDVDAVESVLAAREKISKKLREGDDVVDIKLHRGGIRDIEFLTQCLQRLYGRDDPWVRSGGTLFALRKLNDKGLLPDSDYAALTSSYEFFRKVEHRIQLEIGKQTHRLPSDRDSLDRLARRVGSTRGPAPESGAALLAEIQRRFAQIDEIYERSLHPRRVMPKGETFELRPPASASLDSRAHSLEDIIGFLSAHAPQLAEQIREVPMGERARRHVASFLAAVLVAAERFEQARADPPLFRRALEVAASSEFLGELLIHHPEDLAALETRAAPRGTGESQIAIPLDPLTELAPFAWVRDEHLDLRDKMALLRRDFRAHVLALGAGDLLEWKSVVPALEAWSLLARKAVASALEMAARSLGADSMLHRGEMPLVVLGLGRLGLSEFDLASDADLIFVLAEGADHRDMTPWTRLAEKTIEVLSSYTRDGTVFVVDTRLRPRGQEGELVITEESLIAYLRESAQVWEGLTYLKATPVAGHGHLARRVAEKASALCLDRFSSTAGFEDEMRKMRRRLETEVIVPPSNTKTVPGGYYDVDFVVSLLRIRERVKMATGTSMRGQIESLRSGGLLDSATARTLTEGAGFLRAVDHAIRLVTGKAVTGLPEHVGHAEAIERVAQRWGLIEPGQSLAARLREHQESIRQVYRRVFTANYE